MRHADEQVQSIDGLEGTQEKWQVWSTKPVKAAEGIQKEVQVVLNQSGVKSRV